MGQIQNWGIIRGHRPLTYKIEQKTFVYLRNNKTTKKTMEEVDQFIKKCKEEQEVSDYIHKNIYPESLKPKKIHHYKPPILKDIHIDIIYNDDVKPTSPLKHQHEMLDKVKKLEELLKENVDNHDMCPVCLEPLNNNFISPSCGHTICIGCFTANIRQNNANCELCCLCRKNIVEI